MVSGVGAKRKGAGGEREAKALIASWLAPVYEACGYQAPVLERNLMQSRAGGYDLVGVDWLAIEVKRQENPSLGSWWEQTLRQSRDGQLPVLIWRANRTPWRFRTVVTTLHGWPDMAVSVVPVDLSLESARRVLETEAWARLRNQDFR